MRRKSFIIVLVLVWAGLMAWLIRYEVFPERFGASYAGYRDYFKRGLVVMDNWMVISFKGARIGYSHTQIDIDEASLGQQTLIDNQTMLRMKIMDQVQLIRVSAQARLDILHNLQAFDFTIGSRGFFINLDGQRVKGQTFKINLHSTGGDQQLKVEIPDDAVVYSPMTELALRQLEPGREIRLRTFNPATMGIDDVAVRAIRRETLKQGAREYRTVLLSIDYHGMEVKSWIDLDEGVLVRQETPMGWVLETSTPGEALRASTGESGGEDILTAMAVPSSRPIATPRSLDRLHIKLRGPGLTNLVGISRRQIVNRGDSEGVELTVSADAIPAPVADTIKIAEEVRQLTNSTTFIQSAHPALVRQARQITATATNAVSAALAINDWVFRNVEKKTTVSLPSALDVLKLREGDCNEHTYLAVAFARAIGLPAKVMVGIVYHKGAFYYHAWPAIYVGRWLEMDPTFGQSAVDATHIALLEGELQDQMKLMSLLGRMQIEIISDGTPSAGGKARP